MDDDVAIKVIMFGAGLILFDLVRFVKNKVTVLCLRVVVSFVKSVYVLILWVSNGILLLVRKIFFIAPSVRLNSMIMIGLLVWNIVLTYIFFQERMFFVN